jgi:hypothetical protein
MTFEAVAGKDGADVASEINGASGMHKAGAEQICDEQCEDFANGVAGHGDRPD